MNVLALRGPSIINNFATTISPSLPIGLAYVVSAIQDLADIEVIDAIAEKPFIADVVPFKNNTSIVGLTPDETIARIQQTPEVCLISSMFSMEWPVTAILIEKIRQRFPDCLIVGGGEHFSAAAEYSLNNSSLDVCVLGEGELTARNLIERIKTEGVCPVDIPGTVLKHPETGEIVRNPKRDRVRKIEEIKYPAWDLFNVDKFLDSGVSNTANGRTDHRAFPIVASRGCPYQCTFCSNPEMWGLLWKARPPKNLIDEMKLWIDRYRINHFDFCDLTAIVNRKWILEFARMMVEENLNVTWGLPSGTRSEALDKEVLQWMMRSGCRDLDYAPESGSNAILKIMKKKINKKAMLKSMRDCYEVGISSKANIIFGYPEEKKRYVVETYLFMLQMAIAGVNDVLVTPVSAYPGSALFEQIRRERNIAIDEEYFLNLSGQGSLNMSPCYSRYYTKNQLQFFKLGAFASFYVFSFMVRPWRLFIVLRDLVKGEGNTRLSMGLINISRRFIKRFGFNPTTEVN